MAGLTEQLTCALALKDDEDHDAGAAVDLLVSMTSSSVVSFYTGANNSDQNH